VKEGKVNEKKKCIIKARGKNRGEMRNRAMKISRRRRINKQTPWPLVRERTIPTERPPLVDEI
jgi:hypothetical protein